MSALFSAGAVAITLALTSACGPAPAAVDAASDYRAQPVTTAPCAPLKVGALFDLTTSMTASRLAPPAVADFDPLLKRIETCGGEIGVGLIDEKPGAPLLRYRADPAPVPPQPKAEGNAITAAIERNNQITAYEERRRNWEQDQGRQTAIADFRLGLEPILARRLDARFSPVWISVQRMAVFMAEPAGLNGQAPLKYCLWVTDGEDTTNAAPATLPPDMKGIAVVNGSGRVGVLGVFRPERFESLSAAIRWMLQQEEGK